MGKDSHPVLYWLMYMGLCMFPYLLCFHILHSVIFSTLSSVLRASFRALRSHCEALADDKFGDATKLYGEINELITEVSRVEGIYVAIQVVIMIICTTMNAFFLVSKFNGVSESLIYGTIIVTYVVWFHWVCRIGESLLNEARGSFIIYSSQLMNNLCIFIILCVLAYAQGKQCCLVVKRLASKDVSGNQVNHKYDQIRQ